MHYLEGTISLVLSEKILEFERIKELCRDGQDFETT